MNPQSKLTKCRPLLWVEALALATAVTGMVYVDKLPAADGAISACGSYVPDDPIERRIERELDELPPPLDPITRGDWWEWRDEQRDRIRKRIDQEQKKAIKDALHETYPDHVIDPSKKDARLAVPVPPGAVEWLLHEVGHYVAATEHERAQPDYGLGNSLTGRDADREWAAWAFEEIVLSPFGPARLIAPPEHRAGVGFTRDRIPEWAMRRAHLGIIELDVDVAGLRDLSSRWLRWAIRERQVSETGLDMGRLT